MARNRLFFRFNKKQIETSSTDVFFMDDINPELVEEEIEKAARLIKVKQFHSGFPEIFSCEQSGGIEVSITQDSEQPNYFHINFRFVTIPGQMTLFREQKLISYHDLKKLVIEYDRHKDQIEEELQKCK